MKPLVLGHYAIGKPEIHLLDMKQPRSGDGLGIQYLGFFTHDILKKDNRGKIVKRKGLKGNRDKPPL